MNDNKWQLNRAGILNFWYYDEEEFHFSKGKLLLRGSNGSGKSVTMQSLIPVLLDGKKSPDRLDPFGSKARKMEDYLLGEKGVVDRDERTGYLFLEYKRQNTNEYITTGIGLRAKRHSNMDFWGFVLLDNRRIGKDFLLYKTEYNAEEGKEQKIPFSRRELENRLETGGKVVRTQREYMELVNRYVFGFENIQTYEELIKLLIQLRSPKLSKEFKPTVIYEILNESLPPLGDEDLRPLSDTIESMDQIKQQLTQLKGEKNSLEKLCKQYDIYNQVLLAEKAQGVMKNEKRVSQLVQKGKQLQQELMEERQGKDDLEKNITILEREQKVLEEEKQELETHDVFKAEGEKQKNKDKLKEVHEKIQKKQGYIQRKIDEENTIKNALSVEEERQSELEKAMKDILEDLEEDGEDARFEHHQLSVEEFHKYYKNEDYEFILWKNQAQEYLKKLENSLGVLRNYSRVMEKYREVEKDLGERRKDLDIKRNEERKWEDFFEEEKSKLLENFHHWRKNNQKLLLTDDEVQQIVQRILQIYEEYRFEEVREPMIKAFYRENSELEKSLAGIQKEIEIKKEEIKEKKEELDEWKKKEDPEPPRHIDTIQARKKLKKENIPFVPFYAAVEFKKEISPEYRERIESAITQMGLLDALILPQRLVEVDIQSDRIIKTKPNPFGFTLAEFLYPTPTPGIDVSSQDIDDALRSIVIDQEEGYSAFIQEDGRYQIGILKGKAPKEEKSLYIGKESRRQYRLQEINRLEKELEEFVHEEKKWREEEAKVHKLQEQLKIEYNDFPTDQDVHVVFDSLKNTIEQIKLLKKEVEEKNQKIKILLEERQRIQESLKKLTHGITLTISEEDFEEAKIRMNDYLEQLQGLELGHKDFMNSIKNKLLYEQRYEDIKYEVDESKGELSLLVEEEETLQLTLEKLEGRLQEMGAEDIRNRISKVILRLKEIPQQVIFAKEQRVRSQSTIENIEKNRNTIKIEETMAKKIYVLWQKIFVEDDRLQFLEEVDPQCWSSEEAILKRAKVVWNNYGYRFSKENLDREKVSSRLNASFYQELAQLIEYRPVQENTSKIESDIDMSEMGELDNAESYHIQMDLLIQKSRRNVLILEYNGQRVSPYYILGEIEKDVALQEQLLGDRDQELYEEIIMNSVGRIIRGRIQRAQDWVEKINKLMQERDTSSGLKFSLRWKPRTAEEEEQLDTEELVQLLRLNPKLLKEKDLQKVTQHFRSKIQRAKELVEEKGYGETLHQMIKEVLDYRQWFSFKLYYKMEGQAKKELTNNVFYTFSGGEKAMAMYIPLFSAAYSRYMEARGDAPYIISLDEAFAGVDENNIRDMFDLVEKLGFNYIINSQALWGDYDTVSSLAICELVRPKNAPFVTVIPYHWDGNQKYLLTQEEDAGSYYGEEGEVVGG